ncbi:methionyl aminopeptidase [Motilibacter rhizosphaerae]|uniref:Methionine aminopeptidase n=1 Tax=Motilibacter rhizosphaerae TaxID=598652 RepID=A0A4Q7NU77_9ACTN|nr:type I methionyl aminopeptidase [Motilibacter rhizosphaerae]RZS90388.1 methionyl aminopeptidase [Motilibacter rhizosphaerae]
MPFRRRARFELKTEEQFALMRRAGLIVAEALAAMVGAARPGVTTRELDAVAERLIRSSGAVPSFLGYHGFPATTCLSVGAEVVHGIPGERVLAEGEVLSLDCGAVYEGWHGDSALTVVVGGEPGDEVAGLLRACEDAMWAGIAAARDGAVLGDVSAAVEGGVRAAGAYGIVQGYGGHGIGTSMHMDPLVPNTGPAGRGPELVAGMALAIEPMVTLGSPDVVELDDGWTVVTADGSLAAHFEHTVAITPDGPWVLTAPDGGRGRLGR